MLGAMKKNQLLLLETPSEWAHIDEHTKEVGRRGLEQARQALAEAMKRRAA
jgi:hypothetical protein